MSRDDERLLIHHTDSDGYVSAAIAWRYGSATAHLGHSYGQEIDTARLDRAVSITLVDISLPQELMEKYRDKIIYIDHHKSALEKFVGFKGLQNVDRAGCWLTWDYFVTERERPAVVVAIDSFDRWTHGGNPEILKWNTLCLQLINPQYSVWEDLLADKEPEFEVLMRALYWCEEQKTLIKIKKSLGRGTLDGHSVLFTGIYANSQQIKGAGTADIYANGRYDWLTGLWTYSLYSDSIDVLKYAQAYPGGGGHPKACGFTTDIHPRTLFNIV